VDDDVEIALEAVQLSPHTGPGGARVVGAVGVVDDGSPRGAKWHGLRVLVGMFDACGECDVCRRGGAPVCPRGRVREVPGGARRMRAATRWLVALDDGLVVAGAAAAAVPGDVALAYTLYARTGVAPRDPVVVTGGDAVARFLVEVLVAKGIAPVVVADPADDAWCVWLAARGAGVARVVPAASDADARAGVRDALAALAQDPTAAKAGGRPWRVIATAALARAAALAGPRATLTTCVATATADAAAGPALLAALAREVAILGVAAPHPDLVLETAALAAKGELDLSAGTVVRRADEAPPRDPTRSDVVVVVSA